MAAAIWPRSSGCSVGCYSDISEVGLAGKVRGQMKRRGVAFRDINPARLKTEELSIVSRVERTWDQDYDQMRRGIQQFQDVRSDQDQDA